MASRLPEETPDETALLRVAALFGGRRTLRHPVSTRFDAHEMILQGIPGEALMHLVGHLGTLQKSASFEKAVGMSLRTLQRRKEAPAKLLSQEQSGRAWKFAEILVQATAVLGSQ